MTKAQVSLQKLDQLVHDFKRMRQVIHDQYVQIVKVLDAIDKTIADLAADMDVKKERT